jgi:sec-independent protein translocase protein TatC
VLKIKDIDQTQAPLLDHQVELRTRLLRCILALGVAFAGCFYFAADIFAILVRPLASAFPSGTDPKLVFTQLYEAFFVEIKVALFAAFFLTFPVIANQLWAFVAPGLYAKEKRAFLPFLLATPVLFISGASLAYFIVMPTAFKWLLAFQSEAGGVPIEALPAMGGYLDLVMRFILAFGISFLLPVLMLLLNRAGLIDREQFARSRRFVIVGIFIVAAIATPPDVVSQLILAIPLMILFEGSLLLMPRTKKDEDKADEAKAEALPAPAPAEQASGVEPAPTPPAA